MHHHVGPRTPPKWCTAAGHMVHPAAGEIALSYLIPVAPFHQNAHTAKIGEFCCHFEISPFLMSLISCSSNPVAEAS